MQAKRISRRCFVARTAGAGAALSVFSIVPRHVLGGPGNTPPSEKLTQGVIGVGSMGKNHLGMGGSQLLAVCDVDETRLQKALTMAQSKGFKDVQAYKDFREVLDRPDIDIVHVPTTPPLGTPSFPSPPRKRARIFGAKSP